MNKFVMTAAVLGAFAFAANVTAAGNAAAGQKKAATVCAACHGADGNSASGQFPKLAGQNAGYIVRELERFKSGKRPNPIMSGMAMGLSDQDMQDVAAWFSSQQVRTGEAAPGLVKAGEALFRGGDASAQIPACAACHGPDGAGNAPMLIPALAGQHAEYVISQLQAFASGARKSPMMGTIADRLDANQMKAVASYIEGLHATPVQP
ncbi:MAG TPA: c-type cytochrome [Gammaproteobacteria bacterium]|jgi:cytochrome c553|nr:c-type cytochrome [Gammaproteobacteria bacterium]